MGHFGSRTPRQVLLADAQRAKTDWAGDGKLGAHCRHHGPVFGPVELGDADHDDLDTCIR